MSQAAQQDSANSKRFLQTHYKPGDSVYISTRNFKTLRPSRKLDYKYAGPYKVIGPTGESGITYKLDLPDSLPVHNAFHVSLLQPAEEDPLPGQHVAPPPPIQVQRDGLEVTEWEVEKILDSKSEKQRGRVPKGQLFASRIVKYLVKWKDWHEATWEPLEHLLPNAKELVFAHHRRYPDKSIPGNLIELSYGLTPSSEVQLHAVTTVPWVSSNTPVQPLAVKRPAALTTTEQASHNTPMRPPAMPSYASVALQ